MTFASLANRMTKHFQQALTRSRLAPESVGTIDLTPRVPTLAFLNAKMRPNSQGGRKGVSGHGLEHAQANRDNLNPFKGEDGKWYWYMEDETTHEGSYVTREAAEIDLLKYAAWLNNTQVKEEV